MVSPEMTNSAEFTKAPEKKNGIMQRVGKVAARLALAGAAIAMPFMASNDKADAAPTQDPSCYGDYCSGLFPDTSGCATNPDDVETVYQQPVTRPASEVSTSMAISSDGAYEMGVTINPGHEQVGVLEIRESKQCGTRWARLSTFIAQDVSDITLIQADGYSTTYDASPYMDFPGDDQPGIFFTPQIYVNSQVRAEVGAPGTDSNSVHTPWIS